MGGIVVFLGLSFRLRLALRVTDSPARARLTPLGLADLAGLYLTASPVDGPPAAEMKPARNRKLGGV